MLPRRPFAIEAVTGHNRTWTKERVAAKISAPDVRRMVLTELPHWTNSKSIRLTGRPDSAFKNPAAVDIEINRGASA